MEQNEKGSNDNLLSKLCFLKQKSKSKNISVNLMLKEYGKYEQIKLFSSALIPFGIEKFYGKELLNVELGDNNKEYNTLSLIKQLDSYLSNINNLPKSLSNVIANKVYISCIKQTKNTNKSLLRMHVRKNKNRYITNFVYKNDEPILDLSQLKKKRCDISITVNNLWISDESYGMLIYINYCKII